MDLCVIFFVCHFLCVNTRGIYSVGYGESESSYTRQPINIPAFREPEAGILGLPEERFPDEYVVSLSAELSQTKLKLERTSIKLNSSSVAMENLNDKLKDLNQLMDSILLQAGSALIDVETPVNTLEVLELKLENLKLQKYDDAPEDFAEKISSLSQRLVDVKEMLYETISKLYITITKSGRLGTSVKDMNDIMNLQKEKKQNGSHVENLNACSSSVSEMESYINELKHHKDSKHGVKHVSSFGQFTTLSRDIRTTHNKVRETDLVAHLTLDRCKTLSYKILSLSPVLKWNEARLTEIMTSSTQIHKQIQALETNIYSLGLSSAAYTPRDEDQFPIFGHLDHVKNELVPPERKYDRAEMTFPPGLSIDTSKVVPGSQGVWTDSYIPSRTLFGPLEGVIVPVEDIYDFNQYYLYRIRLNATSVHYLDFWPQSQSTWLRYVEFAEKPSHQNLVQILIDGELYYYAFRPIEAGSELAVAVDAEHAHRLENNAVTWSINPVFDETRWPFFYRCRTGSCSHRLGQCEKPIETNSTCPDCYGFESYDCPLVGDFHVMEDTKVSADGYTKDRDIQSMPPGISIRNSTVKGAGLGIFAEQYFPTRTRFGPIGGFRINDRHNANRIKDYTWVIFKDGYQHHYLDVIDKSTSSWLRYVNTANTKEVQNLRSIQCGDMVYYYAFRPIYPGDELFNWYGELYDQYLGINRQLITWNPRYDETRWPFFYTCPVGNCIEKACPAVNKTTQQ